MIRSEYLTIGCILIGYVLWVGLHDLWISKKFECFKVRSFYRFLFLVFTPFTFWRTFISWLTTHQEAVELLDEITAYVDGLTYTWVNVTEFSKFWLFLQLREDTESMEIIEGSDAAMYIKVLYKYCNIGVLGVKHSKNKRSFYFAGNFEQ